MIDKFLQECRTHFYNEELQDIAWFNSLPHGERERFTEDKEKPWRGAMRPSKLRCIKLMEAMGEYEGPQ